MPHRRLALLKPSDAARIYLGMNLSRKRMVQDDLTPLVPIHTMMAARIYVDELDGDVCTVKRVITEVAPSWTSEATARRVLSMMEKSGTVMLEENPNDRRAHIVHGTDKLRRHVTSLFASSIEEARKAVGEDIYKIRRNAHG